MFGKKKDQKATTVIRRKQSFFKLPEFNFKRITFTFVIFFLIFIVLISSSIFISQYRTENYKINELKHVKIENINNILVKYTEEPLVRINTSEIENEIKNSSIFIDKVSVSKTIFDGLVIQVVENDPLVLIQTLDQKLFYIDTNYQIHEVKNDSEVANLEKIDFLSSDIHTSNLINYLKKVIKIREKLGAIKYNQLTFDNFGNLSILLEGEKVIRFDLNERFFAIDEQLSLLQDTLSKNQSFTEIDLRFSYLLIK